MKYILFLFLIIGCTPVGDEFILGDVEDAGEDVGTVEDASSTDASLCATECLTNSDCDYLGGICVSILTKGFERSMCSSDCSSDYNCELGFSCVPIWGATDWNWQCLVTTTTVCD